MSSWGGVRQFVASLSLCLRLSVTIKHDTVINRAYHKIAGRKGRKVALVATAHRLALCCYSILKNRSSYMAFPVMVRPLHNSS